MYVYPNPVSPFKHTVPLPEPLIVVKFDIWTILYDSYLLDWGSMNIDTALPHQPKAKAAKVNIKNEFECIVHSAKIIDIERWSCPMVHRYNFLFPI